VSSLREHVNKSIVNMALKYRETSDQIVDKFQTGMSKYINQIKGISTDNLQQLRKITMLNHQQVTSRHANHFTETDGSEKIKEPDIRYFSDTKEDVKKNLVFEKKDLSNYYMSEDDTKKTHESDYEDGDSKDDKEELEIASKDEENNVVCDGDKCMVVKEAYNSELNKDHDIPIYNTDHRPINIDLPIYNSNNNTNKNDDNNNNNNSEKNITTPRILIEEDEYIVDEHDETNGDANNMRKLRYWHYKAKYSNRERVILCTIL
jgi:hypothetical protein